MGPPAAAEPTGPGRPPSLLGGAAASPSRLTIVPCTLRAACAFIEQHHRHHPPPQGGRFACAVADEAGRVRGVAIVGTPVARLACDGWRAEVTRVATDGCPNACSALYAACWRACRALGYRELITYTLASESGGSLRAAGWRQVGACGGGTWSTPSRPRIDLHPTQEKFKWVRS